MKAPIDTLPAWRDYQDYKTSPKPQLQKKLVSITRKYHGSPFITRGGQGIAAIPNSKYQIRKEP
jgi:hypothetical protein